MWPDPNQTPNTLQARQNPSPPPPFLASCFAFNTAFGQLGAPAKQALPEIDERRSCLLPSGIQWCLNSEQLWADCLQMQSRTTNFASQDGHCCVVQTHFRERTRRVFFVRQFDLPSSFSRRLRSSAISSLFLSRATSTLSAQSFMRLVQRLPVWMSAAWRSSLAA